MKKIYKGTFHCLAMLMLVSSASFAQGYDTVNWKFSNPKRFGFTVTDVDYFDNNNVLAVGSDGGIAKSTDGGTTWSYGVYTYNDPAGFRGRPSFTDVHFVTSNIAYATGAFGTMAKTTDGGLTWNFVNTPLFANQRSINAVWFVNQNTGYIGGDWNTPDSIPKLYFTNNGGATWDSLNAPVGGKSRVGYINNPNLAPLIWNVTAKGKTIQRIEFTSANNGYIIGSSSSTTIFAPFPAVNATTCLPTGGTATTTADAAPLVWKFSNGVLTDYSVSKEKLGYSGIITNTIVCNTQYNASQITPVNQTYRALNIYNDSLIVMMSFNNNTVLRVRTGRNDSTLNMATGLKEPGLYEVTNFPFPPTQGPQAGSPIPNPQVLLASNPYQIRKSSGGKLHATANFGLMWTSIDTGRNWVRELSLPQGKNYSSFGTWALDIAPNGRFLSMGSNGVVADSMPGNATWNSSYILAPSSSNEIDFADCNNGIVAGGSAITVTTDGGATWIDKNRADFAASFYNIAGIAYPNVSKAWFAVSNGVIYSSPDKGTTLDPSYSDGSFVMNDVAAFGNDTAYAVGYSHFSVPAANRKSTFFRTVNGGTTWTTVDIAVTTTSPVFTAPTISHLSFPSRNIGYAAGNRNAIYKTTDGGATWTSINPFPSLNAGPAGFPNSFITYTEVFALNDNTVFAVGNMFTSANNRRVYKSTDGGATWVDIIGNIPSFSSGAPNLTGVLFHDANNGYVSIAGGMYKTSNGGTTWTLELSPSNTLFNSMAFAPRTVPAAIGFANRKLFVSGAAVAVAHIMEYGNPANINVNATTTVVNTSCGNASGGSITVNATGGIAPYTYNINGGTFGTNNVFSGLTAGVKSIQVKDAYCGITTIPVTVGFTDNLTLTASNDTTVCAGAPVPLLATSIAGATFAWTPVAGLSSATIANPVATVSSPTTYTVTATLGTCVKTEPVVINIRPNPVVSAGPDKTILAGDQVTLNGTASGATNIAWTPAASLTNANTLTPIARPAVTTTYTLTVRNTDNCTSTDDVLVTVIPICVNVMNAFSPNGDGINDLWKVTSGTSCTNQIQVNVYNRYGNEVYRNANYNNDWNGQYNGKPVADGTYYYKVTLRLLNGTTTSLTGDVTILR